MTRVHYNRKRPELVIEADRIIRGGALQTVQSLPENSIGAVISDPPFFTGISRDGGGFGKDPWEGIDSVATAGEWATAIMQEFRRVVRPGGAIAVMCGIHAAAAWMMAAENAGLPWMAELIVLWNTGKPRVNNFGSLHTNILWFTCPGAKHTWNSHRKSFYSNIIVCRKIPIQYRRHISEKPIELTNFLVSLLSRPDDVVLDPFCGSGSTLVSADLAGRHWLGIDKDKVHVATARHRTTHSEQEEDHDMFFWLNSKLIKI